MQLGFDGALQAAWAEDAKRGTSKTDNKSRRMIASC
jgi:hypothetical protein